MLVILSFTAHMVYAKWMGSATAHEICGQKQTLLHAAHLQTAKHDNLCPVDNQTVVMRQPLNRAQAETLISEMPQYAVVPIMDAKERESRCREALQTCDCREIAKMIKGLHDRHESVYSTKSMILPLMNAISARRRNGCTVSLLMPLA